METHASPGGMGHGPGAAPREVGGILNAVPGPFELVPRHFWETIIFSRRYRDHDRDAPSIIEHLYELKTNAKRNIDSGVAPSSKSKDGLFESTFDLFERTTHDGLRRLVAFIESSIKRAVWYANGRSVDWFDMRRAAQGMKAPAMIVHSLDDDVCPVDQVQAVASAWAAGAELVLTDGMGHRDVARDSDVADRIAAFLA
jgi:pimeloyl-ACP methyl ester carboxylesterase